MKALVLCLLISVCAGAVPQSEAQPSTPAPAVIRELSPPIYPPLARQAQIQGLVEIDVVLRRDGQLESEKVVSGHPILMDSALESARKSKYECAGCTETLTTRRISYSFELGEPVDCTPIEVPGNPAYALSARSCVRQTGNAVVLMATIFQEICGATSIRIPSRSFKCFYLWKCGHKR